MHGYPNKKWHRGPKSKEYMRTLDNAYGYEVLLKKDVDRSRKLFYDVKDRVNSWWCPHCSNGKLTRIDDKSWKNKRCKKQYLRNKKPKAVVANVWDKDHYQYETKLMEDTSKELYESYLYTKDYLENVDKESWTYINGKEQLDFLRMNFTEKVWDYVD